MILTSTLNACSSGIYTTITAQTLSTNTTELDYNHIRLTISQQRISTRWHCLKSQRMMSYYFRPSGESSLGANSLCFHPRPFKCNRVVLTILQAQLTNCKAQKNLEPCAHTHYIKCCRHHWFKPFCFRSLWHSRVVAAPQQGKTVLDSNRFLHHTQSMPAGWKIQNVLKK